MPGLYLAIVLGGLIGMYLIDRRHGLVLAANPKVALLTIAASVAFFSVWDAAGIVMGIFFTGSTNWLVGFELGPEYPIEELFFLTLFSYTTLVVYRFIAKQRSK